MNDEEAGKLCLNLIQAESETEVIDPLTDAGFWNDPKYWRYYGDRETNFNTIGNQQSRPDAALVEKLVNSVDARLMNECLVRGVLPEDGQNVPLSVRDAVAAYFEGDKEVGSIRDGTIKNWPDRKRTAVTRGITPAGTGPATRWRETRNKHLGLPVEIVAADLYTGDPEFRAVETGVRIIWL